MFTVSGLQIDLLDPLPTKLNLHDIAIALSNLCRYNGQTTTFYSVAQHSVLTSHLVPEDLALEALLHDATEAYLGDVTRPLKALLPNYQSIERNFDLVIRQAFGLPYEMSAPVKHADQIMLATEVRDLSLKIPDKFIMGGKPTPWSNHTIVPDSPLRAYASFVERFKFLGGHDAYPCP